MSGDHAKGEIMTGGDKSASSGRTHSRESGPKHKKMKKVVYYETHSSSPSTSGSDTASVTSKRHERKKYSRCHFVIPVFLSALLYFPFH